MAFEEIVDQYYAPLFRFALSLTRTEHDASDLTQHTFYLWARKGHQLRDSSKVKSWLFTSLHRAFLEWQRKTKRFPTQDLEAIAPELPNIDPVQVQHLDAQTVVEQLGGVDELFQAPVALFYLEDYSYQEIADILRIPLGTVKSRIARGLAQLQSRLLRHIQDSKGGAVP